MVKISDVGMSIDEVRSARKEIESRIASAKEALAAVEKELKQLQNSCSHPHKHWQPEYDFYANWCDDCGKFWSE